MGMRELMNFFVTANTQLYERLIAMLEGDENPCVCVGSPVA